MENKDARALEVLSQFCTNTTAVQASAVEQVNVTKNTSVVFILPPMWALYVPPYNVARLLSIAKHYGYKADAIDVNAYCNTKCRHHVAQLGYDPWSDVYMPKWLDERYEVELAPILQEHLDYCVDRIVELNPTVLGVTMYVSNIFPSKYICQKVRERLPHITIAVGGPLWHRTAKFNNYGVDADFIVRGEGELQLIELLNQVEEHGRPSQLVVMTQDINQRIDLNDLPVPDYSFCKPTDYKLPNASTLEFSRGCIAKCVFCDETHYWKFRSKDAKTVFTEVKELYSRGIDVFWFVDSLVNGNLSALKQFCEEVISNQLTIKWHGWARCDGRMDLDYFKMLVAAGCVEFGYGVESGSNKVLADMKKGITREEVEANFRDHTAAGMNGIVMMIIGFPTEDHQDFYDSMTLLWRIHKYQLSWIAGGFGCNVDDDTVLGRNRSEFGISKMRYGDQWATQDFSNTKLHRLIRLKLFNIFLNSIDTETGNRFTARENIKKDYELVFQSTEKRPIEYEQFDFALFNTGYGVFADSLVNEFWPLVRLLWKSRGPFSLVVRFVPEHDYNEFGPSLAHNLTATFSFSINELGQWDSSAQVTYVQPDGSWVYHRFPESDTNVTKRVAILANSKKLNYQARSAEDINREERELTEHYKTVDFSFSTTVTKSGQW